MGQSSPEMSSLHRRKKSRGQEGLGLGLSQREQSAELQPLGFVIGPHLGGEQTGDRGALQPLASCATLTLPLPAAER